MPREQAETQRLVVRRPPLWRVGSWLDRLPRGRALGLWLIACFGPAILFGASFLPAIPARAPIQFFVPAAVWALALFFGGVLVGRFVVDSRQFLYGEVQERPWSLSLLRILRYAHGTAYASNKFIGISMGFALLVALEDFIFKVFEGEYLTQHPERAPRILAVLVIAWMALRLLRPALYGVAHWPAALRAHHALRRHQASLEDHDAFKTQFLVTPAHLESLRTLRGLDLSIDFQLAALGLRPEATAPVPQSWQAQRDTHPTATVILGYECNPEAQRSNEEFIAKMALLLTLGLVHIDGSRLRLTSLGHEQLTLPETAFISNLPGPTRATLARAELKLRAGEPRACANLCGASLESFLKATIRGFLPDEELRRNTLTAWEIRGSLTSMSLGGLVRALGKTILGKNGAETSHVPLETRREIHRLFEMCNERRKRWSHDSIEQRGLSPADEYVVAEELLHLSRMATTLHCRVFHQDPFAAVLPPPSAEPLAQVEG